MCTAAEVTEVTSCQVYEWLREVCSTTLLQTSIILGGPGVIVEIDESHFRHKPKVYTQGITYICTYISVSTAPSWAGPRQDAWVFGMVDTSHTPALGYMEMVHSRNAATQ